MVGARDCMRVAAVWPADFFFLIIHLNLLACVLIWFLLILDSCRVFFWEGFCFFLTTALVAVSHRKCCIMASRKKAFEETDKLTRIAIINSDKCKPKRCRQECKKSCPVVRMGRLCIEVTPNDKIAAISETLCIGCGICIKVSSGCCIFSLSFCYINWPELYCQKCPFEAITIINLPSNLDRDTTHRYSQNSFKLHRLPTPRAGEVLGLVGTNGIGKSTALKILAGKLKPNLGRYNASFINGKLWIFLLTNFLTGSTWMVWNPNLFSWIRAAKLLHQDPWRWLEGCDQTTVCRPDSESYQGHCAGHVAAQGRDGQQGRNDRHLR